MKSSTDQLLSLSLYKHVNAEYKHIVLKFTVVSIEGSFDLTYVKFNFDSLFIHCPF